MGMGLSWTCISGNIGHSPTPKQHLWSGGLGPVPLSNRQRLHGHHQLNIKQSHLNRFRVCLPSSGWHTDKYLTNGDHIRRLFIRRTSWVLCWASPRIMSHTVKPHNPHRTTIHLPPGQFIVPANANHSTRRHMIHTYIHIYTPTITVRLCWSWIGVD